MRSKPSQKSSARVHVWAGRSWRGSRGLSSGSRQLARLGPEFAGEVRRLVTITAPENGIVLNRGVSQGTAVDPSTEILTLADLSRIWVIAEIIQNKVYNIFHLNNEQFDIDLLN